jgi:enterochelin esterase-like enzyme
MRIALFLLLAAPLVAQTPMPPEVRQDRTVFFKLKAPNAQKVMLALEGAVPKPMTKADDGSWTLTTEALEPDIYGYSFIIDGTMFTDPSNCYYKLNLLFPASMVLVPGQTPQPWEQTNVAHGTVRHHFYESKIVGDKRDFFVYTPPNYNPKKSYPMMALLHGFSDTAIGWTEVGKANLILDNLMAAGQVKPMIVVMPLGYGFPVETLRSGAPASPALMKENVTKFGEALLQEVIPMVESNYKIDKKRERRAIVGLSMGGSESLTVGLGHLDKFAWIGAFSSGGVQKPAETLPQLSEQDNARIKLLWIACGKSDGLIKANREFVDYLNSKKIHNTFVETSGAHTWMVWRRNLAEFTKLLNW